MKKTNSLKKFTFLTLICTGFITSLTIPNQVKADSGYAMTQEQASRPRFEDSINYKSDHCLIMEIIYEKSDC
jgi:hypothetical protein